MQAFQRIKPKKRKKHYPHLTDPWVPLKEQPNLIFHIIDQQAKEIHPPVVWWNGRLYYQINPGVLTPIKD